MLCAWLGFVFLLGGNSQPDMPFLLSLRPLAVLVLAYALSRLSAEQVRQNRFLLTMGAAWIALPLLQLLPLPPAIWHALPGREIVAQIDREADLIGTWRPLSLAPETTWNALWSMLIPFATLLLGVQIPPERRGRLLALLMAFGCASALLGMLQIIGDADNPLYFHRISDHGYPVGLLANRNHQAAVLACLLAMAGAWVGLRGLRISAAGATRPQWLWILLGGSVAVIIPLILVTQSRSGTVLGVLAGLALPMLIGRSPFPGSATSKRWIGWALAAGVVGLALLAGLGGRITSFDRFVTVDALADRRVQILPTVLSMTETYAPWGTGLGTFDKVFRVHEPDGQLQPTFMNHAHNDWLELALTGGLPALILLAIGAAMLVRRVPRLWKDGSGREDVLLGRLGLAIIGTLALASITDYPLRVPSIACMATIAALWLASVGAASGARRHGEGEIAS